MRATSLVTASPFPRAVTKFIAGATFHIVSNNNNKGLSIANLKARSVIDIDLFDTSDTDIKELGNTNMVICYFSTGAREDWPDDDCSFKAKEYGKSIGDWAGDQTPRQRIFCFPVIISSVIVMVEVPAPRRMIFALRYW
jgi:hypothetical protein